MNDGRYVFYGFINTKLYWTSQRQEWRLELLSDPNTFASLNMTEYPFGTFDWSFFHMSCDGKNKLTGNNTDLHRLNLNACHDEEFNCADGG